MSRQQVLFVDDEERVLQGLRRMLYPMRREWQMNFALSGDEALAVFERDEVDVLVSDMRMPGMDGAQLMTKVAERYPQTVRIALSGHSEEEANLRLVGQTHQYLSKPCDPETLKATVRRACILRDQLHEPPVQRLVTQVAGLPSLPERYRELSSELKSSQPSMERVCEIIASDPAMSARVLQLANSAFFGQAQVVASPVEAAIVLGVRTLRALVLSVSAFPAFEGPGIPQLPVDELWRHASRAARYAAIIARAEGAELDTVEAARTAGLLHDVGRLLLVTQMRDRYASIVAEAVETQVELGELERRDLGATHAAIGAYLLGVWGLPEPVIDAVAYHNKPGAGPSEGFSALTAAHVADILEQEVSAANSPLRRPGLDREYLANLGLEGRVDAWRALCTASIDGS